MALPPSTPLPLRSPLSIPSPPSVFPPPPSPSASTLPQAMTKLKLQYEGHTEMLVKAYLTSIELGEDFLVHAQVRGGRGGGSGHLLRHAHSRCWGPPVRHLG